MKYWRTKCDFDAYQGKVHVEGRVHFELAETAEEATEMSIAYLESCHYTNVKVTECHAETEEEKYGKSIDELIHSNSDCKQSEDSIQVKPVELKHCGVDKSLGCDKQAVFMPGAPSVALVQQSPVNTKLEDFTDELF